MDEKKIIEENKLESVNGGTMGTDASEVIEAIKKQNEQMMEDFRADYKEALEKIDRTSEILSESIKELLETNKHIFDE